jgi:uncharacterized membrane protein
MSADFLHFGVGRWLHVMAGVMWVGLLYYFNFVQAAALRDAQADGSAAGISRHVVPRAFLYFRWAAVVTWLAGAWLLGDRIDEAFLFKERAYIPIGVGAWLGTIMFFNVFAIIWPNQKKVLGLSPATEDEKARARRVAFLGSRINVMLSMPMLFFMTASGGIFRTALFAP